jgi:hypothetical protein
VEQSESVLHAVLEVSRDDEDLVTAAAMLFAECVVAVAAGDGSLACVALFEVSRDDEDLVTATLFAECVVAVDGS